MHTSCINYHIETFCTTHPFYRIISIFFWKWKIEFRILKINFGYFSFCLSMIIPITYYSLTFFIAPCFFSNVNDVWNSFDYFCLFRDDVVVLRIETHTRCMHSTKYVSLQCFFCCCCYSLGVDFIEQRIIMNLVERKKPTTNFPKEKKLAETLFFHLEWILTNISEWWWWCENKTE